MGRNCSIAPALDLCIAFEAAVAGGIPIIANISQCLSANQIQSLRGILNGTSNFILTQMEEQGADYHTAVHEAQKLGYAEADPTMDVDGSDATQKLAILAHLAFGARVNWRDIPRRGIDGLDIADLKYAKELGYRIKLMAMAELQSGGVDLHVSPMLVKIGTPLAEVRGAFNAISVVGDAVGPLMFHGQGAGQMPTASAVVADMIDMVVGRSADYLPHVGAVVGPGVGGAAVGSCQIDGQILFAVLGGRRAGRVGRHRWDFGQSQDFDRLGDSARRRSNRRWVHAAGDHDAHGHGEKCGRRRRGDRPVEKRTAD